MYTNSLNDFIDNPDATYYSRISNESIDDYRCVYPGSFNPLHYGHLSIANYAQKNVSKPLFEVCINNFDKDTLTKPDIIRIQQQFTNIGRDVVFTKYQSFLAKTNIFGRLQKERCFLIGMDTLNRLLDKKYCFDSEEELENSWRILRFKKFRFNVYPRHNFEIPQQIPDYTKSIVHIINDVPLYNISSTELRLKDGKQNAS